MPDKRRHRGRHPDDGALFAPQYCQALRSAVEEFSWLLSHEYTPLSALKLVGDRHNLTARQRTAVQRSACSDTALERRKAKISNLSRCRSTRIAIDGYNLLITIESALSGGLIIIGRDGCARDLASIHGTYRKVEETIFAIRMIAEVIRRAPVAGVDWYLDRPVSNSGRLKTLMAGVLDQLDTGGDAAAPWNLQLLENPDAVLSTYAGPVVTSDSIVLDQCGSWINLAAALIDSRIPGAWVVDLGSEASASGRRDK